MFTTRSRDPRRRDCGATDEQLTGDLGASGRSVVRLRQVHSGNVVRATEAMAARPEMRTEADGVISTDPDIVLAVRVADCVPLLIGDDRRRAVAAVHAGWRGTAAAIARVAVEALEQAGCVAADLTAAVGPSIGPCCYQVGEDVRDAFILRHGSASEHWFRPDGTGKWTLDMWQATQDQLSASGVAGDRIHIAGLCTVCNGDRFYSFRREGNRAGRMEGLIRLAR